MFFLLIWFQVLPDQGVRYHHLGTFENNTICMAELKHASVMVNDSTETIECIGVKTYGKD
jgi:hypothetical protein